MAALIGDVFAESPSHFHGMIGGHSHDIHYQSRSVSRSRDRDAQSHHTPRPTATPRRPSASVAGSQSQPPSHRAWDEQTTQDRSTAQAIPNRSSTSERTARLPSPPPSSSSSQPSSGGAQPQHEIPRDGAQDHTPGSFPSSDSSASSASTAATVIAPPSRSIPSPDSDGGPRWNFSHAPTAGSSSIPPHLDDTPESPIQTQTTIRVRDLAHIQSLAKADLLTGTGPGILNDPPLQQMKYEISGMPIGDIIEMVAALLTKITTTNDLQHDALNRNAHHLKQAQAQARGEEGSGESSMSPLSSSVLAFHGKNVPAITILSYLSRIHKYCPTTYEVFLSLLVYFDRMTERVNDMVVKSEGTRRSHLETPQQSAAADLAALDVDKDTVMRDGGVDDDSSDATETDSELADSTDGDESPAASAAAGWRSTGAANNATANPHTAGSSAAAAAAAAQATYFVVDSFNIHRLIIAGVTCASKFFSDVFYTNSRYAKVGGLPLPELNHLELQFLLLNDFRLAVPVEDLEAYATMLVEFYAREVVAQRSRPAGGAE
ncbi:cyclin-domain-containing protein [Chaetomidium leptoderma]|uniref:Cyclin-domain-containing protein n=1 Tax=Chaetomidium leptoderma TaxID=669021 RepID=A0AAN6VJ33_9PEZI|nr:cyclin-domain-containing protein [Chaetomidium leptoderma]